MLRDAEHYTADGIWDHVTRRMVYVITSQLDDILQEVNAKHPSDDPDVHTIALGWLVVKRGLLEPPGSQWVRRVDTANAAVWRRHLANGESDIAFREGDVLFRRAAEHCGSGLPTRCQAPSSSG